MKKTNITYTYKDGYRIWWKIALTRSEEFNIDPWEDNITKENCPDCLKHYHWDYKVYADEKELQIGGLNLLAQYDEVPTVQDVLSDLSNRFNNVFIGFSKYAYEEHPDKTISSID